MNNTLFGYQPITSISYSNDEIIENIMLLYDIDRFDLDCTYSIGQFWKNLPQPRNKSDLDPKRDDIIGASSDNLPFDNDSMSSIMFDPPFVITGKTYKDNVKRSSIIAKRFEGFTSFNQLKKMYYGTIIETFRVLKGDGVLVFKCQDQVSSGKNHFSHVVVMSMAITAGFYPKDLFILMNKNRLVGGNWKTQYHARKHHSYFWVFQKTKNKVDYNF